MGGTVKGGLKAAATNKQRYGLNFYELIGRIGGKISRGGGFAYSGVGSDGLTGRERASIAGVKGGQNSRRSPARDTYAEAVEAQKYIPSRFKQWLGWK
jgi:general stress protein YciG